MKIFRKIFVIAVFSFLLLALNGALGSCAKDGGDNDEADDDGIVGYKWYFGDTSRATGARVEHSYRVAGTYEVIVYAADVIGNT